MTFRRFFTVVAAILLCGVLFCGKFTHFTSAEVVHAYRKPSEADLRWLLGDIPVSEPDSLSIIQVGFTTPSNMLVPRSGPCGPVSVPIPMPSIPPVPETMDSKMNVGLVPEIDGVVNIAPIVVDTATPVVLMTGDRFPPPLEVPREESLVVPLADFTATPLPLPNNREHFSDVPVRSGTGFDFGFGCGDFDDDHSICVCFTCVVSGNDRQNKHCGSLVSDAGTRFCAPDMLGGSSWLTGYYVSANGAAFTLPTMLLSRPNVVERFNADVQNRIWADYRTWNNAVSFDNESRKVEQFSFGLEKKILHNCSVELRVPVIYQFSSRQVNDPATSVELGNVSVFLKQAIHRGTRWTISGGVGTTLPTAEDWRLPAASVRLKNNAYYLVSFFGIQWHPNSNTFGHFVVQTDLPIEKNKLITNSAQEKVAGQQMIRTGIQLGRWIYRVDHSKRPCRLGTFAEVNYAVVTDGSTEQSVNIGGNSMYVSAFGSRKSTLTAAVGVPMVFGRLTCANSLILPISGSNRPFSVGYGFSLSRQF